MAFNLVRSFTYAIRMYLLRRDQYRSKKLRTLFSTSHGINVGMYSYGCFDHWRMPGPMTVGRYCSIAGTVRSVRSNHPLTALTTYPALYDRQFGVPSHAVLDVAPLVIEDDVWIGHNAILLPGCKAIGRGAVIGAGSVVTKNVEPYTIVVGNPARKIAERFDPSLRDAVDASCWWTCDLSELGAILAADPTAIFSPTVSSMAKAFPLRKCGSEPL